MGNYINFQPPITEASFTFAIIERAPLTSTGPFTAITSQVITNNTFYDENGISTDWYRLRFFDDTNSVYSAYSDPFQPTNEDYCTPRDVASFMGRPTFTDTTNPTRYEVEIIIAGVTDDIDKITHHAWRKVRVTNEMHDVRIQDRYQGYGSYPYDYSTRIVAELKHRSVRNFVSGTHLIEVWTGQTYQDFVSTTTQGRVNDWWCNYERGIIYFVNRYPLRVRSNVRVTYDFGELAPPNDIRRAAIMLTASYIVGGKEDLNVVYPQSTMGTVLDTRDRWEKWQKDAEKILDKYRVILSTRYY